MGKGKINSKEDSLPGPLEAREKTRPKQEGKETLPVPLEAEGRNPLETQAKDFHIRTDWTE